MTGQTRQDKFGCKITVGAQQPDGRFNVHYPYRPERVVVLGTQTITTIYSTVVA
jgi:hypothetical protein